MKKIAITQRLVENGSYSEMRECLDVNYSKLIYACGYLPIVLPYEVAFESYFKNIDISGVVLTGGNDLNCCHKSSLSKKRDLFEKKILKYCIENDIRILGICRGMQLIAEYFKSDFKQVYNQVNVRYRLKINQNSKYRDSLNSIKIVNSYHNFSVNKLSDQMVVSATNENGVIKAIEHKNYKIFGQMWHSERENPFNENELNFIKDFFNFDIGRAQKLK